MLDSKILESEWIEPNTEGDGWGYKLKEGAPPEIAKEFEDWEKEYETHRN